VVGDDVLIVVQPTRAYAVTAHHNAEVVRLEGGDYPARQNARKVVAHVDAPQDFRGGGYTDAVSSFCIHDF
jgi:hypothetical protein